MANAHAALEPGEGVNVKDIADHTVCLALVEPSLGAAGDDTGSILSSVLEEGEGLVDLGSGGLVLGGEEDGGDATHGGGWVREGGGRSRWRERKRRRKKQESTQLR